MREILARISVSVFIVWSPIETGCIHYTACSLIRLFIEDQYFASGDRILTNGAQSELSDEFKSKLKEYEP